MADVKILPKDLVLKPFNIFIGFGDFRDDLYHRTEDLNIWLDGELIIEFPEDKKHPSEQYEYILSEFKRWVRWIEGGWYKRVVILTQSPYILTTFNNLIMKHAADVVGGLSFDDIGCWNFNKDDSGNTFTDLMNYDLKFISGNTIDKASDIIHEEFHKYITLAWEKEERENILKENKLLWYC